MKNLILLFISIILIVGCSSPSGSNEDTYDVAGRITDASGSGISDVLITFTGDFSSTRTNEDGFWEKQDLSGTVVARAQKFGYTFDPQTITFSSSNLEANFLAHQEDLNVELYDNVIILMADDRDNIDSFSEDNGVLIFKELTGSIESFTVGDIILSEMSETMPYGLIHKITDISDDGLTFTLEDATLEDVIEEGEIETSYSISFEELVDGLKMSKGVTIKKIDFGDQRIEFEREFSGNRGTISGFIRLNSNIEFDKEMRYRIRLENLRIVFTADVELDVNYEAKIESEYEETYDLFTFRGPPLVIFTGVYVNPRLVFRAGAEASIEGGMESGLNWSRTYVAGIEYRRGEGFETIRNSHGDGFTVKPVTLTGSSEALGFAGVAFEGLIWGSAGFGVGVFGYTKAEGEVKLSVDDWSWEYDFSLGVKIASEAQLRISRIADLTYQGPEYDIYRLPVAYAASGRITEMMVIDGKNEEVGVKDVTLRFDGASAISGSLSDKLTDENGHWYQDLLSREVVVTPEKDGYTFTPEQLEIDKKGSSYNFTAEPIDLSGIWNGNITIRSFGESALKNNDNDDGCLDFDIDIDLEDIIGVPLPIRMDLVKRENEQKYDAKIIPVDIDDDFNLIKEQIPSDIMNQYSSVEIASSEEDYTTMVGEFADNVLTLTGKDDGFEFKFIGNFSVSEDEIYRLSGDWDLVAPEEPEAGAIKGDWGVIRED